MIFFKFSGYVFLIIPLRTHKPQLPSHIISGIDGVLRLRTCTLRTSILLYNNLPESQCDGHFDTLIIFQTHKIGNQLKIQRCFAIGWNISSKFTFHCLSVRLCYESTLVHKLEIIGSNNKGPGPDMRNNRYCLSDALLLPVGFKSCGLAYKGLKKNNNKKNSFYFNFLVRVLQYFQNSF